MVIFYKKGKKYNEIQLTKSKMDLNIRKMTNHPPTPGIKTNKQIIIIIDNSCPSGKNQIVDNLFCTTPQEPALYGKLKKTKLQATNG